MEFQVKPLEITLIAKITLTALLWCLPLIFFPSRLYDWLGFTIGPVIFVRLLGFAYLALLVGYVLACRDVVAGVYPANTILVGLVSNLGACLVLCWGALIGQWSERGWLAQLYMWVSLAATGAISLSLYTCGIKKYGWLTTRVT